MHGSPKPSLAYEVRGGEALSSDPCITIIPLDAVGLKVVANNEVKVSNIYKDKRQVQMIYIQMIYK